jgi:hypothetical protein
VRNFIDYAIQDEHTLILEAWQFLPRCLAEIRSPEPSDNVQIKYLFRTHVEDILSGLKANDPVNDWVLRHTGRRQLHSSR